MSCPKLVLQGLSWSDPSLFVVWRFWHNSLLLNVFLRQNHKIRKKIKKLFKLWMSVTVKQRMNGRVIISDNFQFQIKSTFNFNWHIFFPRTFLGESFVSVQNSSDPGPDVFHYSFTKQRNLQVSDTSKLVNYISITYIIYS